MHLRASLIRFVAASLLWGSLSTLPGCYWLGSEPVPDVSNYDLDLEELRRLARSLPAPLPAGVRVEQVATTKLPGALMMAGRSWDNLEMTHVVFQILQADGRFILIDSAQDREMHESNPGENPFDDVAWERVMRAFGAADQIVITHEHPDHIGGVAHYPNPADLVLSLQLTKEQLENRSALESVDFEAALDGDFAPVDYPEGRSAMVIAPGVVLKKAPGHTPGSQMVYVLLEDGAELLFVGDVVWNLDAITNLVYRPRFMTDWVIGEDRELGIHQLRALRNLYDAGEVSIVVSHDERTHSAPGLTRGFEIPAH